MHSVKLTCVGQTFALAKSNDSGGKKSRIRRSKEDRKAMVESFIKKYQSSNNGSFPSLNLTHKEVGGSFYTVREIVREIIQENRVLGPAKLVEDEQNFDQFHEQYPLGSISIEPQSHVSLSSNETRLHDHQSISAELVSTFSGQNDCQQQQQLDNGRSVNGIMVDGEYKETDASKTSVHVNGEMLYKDVQISKKLEASENIVEVSASKVTPLATDVIVETFPLKATAKDRRSVEAGELTVNLEEQVATKVEVASEVSKSGSVLDTMDPVVMDSSSPLDGNSVENHADKLFENLNSSTTASITSSTLVGKGPEADISCKDDLTLQTTDQDQGAVGMEPKPTPDNVHTKNNNNTSSSQEEPLSQEAVAIKAKAENQNAFSGEEGRNSTLNRTKLESWEGTSKKPTDAETNPVLAVFKAFITAFVKFWSE